jgi:hypothetical protein
VTHSFFEFNELSKRPFQLNFMQIYANFRDYFEFVGLEMRNRRNADRWADNPPLLLFPRRLARQKQLARFGEQEILGCLIQFTGSDTCRRQEVALISALLPKQFRQQETMHENSLF